MNTPDYVTENVIETHGLSKSYKGVQALKALDLQVQQHSICGFLGPNGAGKSTTIKLLLGLAQPTGGSGRVFGKDILKENDEIRRRVGYLAQDPRFYEYMTARETLRFTARFFYEGPKAEIEQPGRGDPGPGGAGRQGGPAGQGLLRRRAAAAGDRAGPGELPRPADPGRTGRRLDPIGRRDVLEVMERLRKHTTIFYSTHILDDVQRVSDTVVILNRGASVAQGPIEEILAWGQAVSFTLTVKGDSAGVEARLRSQPWVTGLQEMSRNGRVSWQIRVSDRDLAEAQLAPLALAGGGVTLCELGCRTQNLEDVFLSVVAGDGPQEENHER